MGRTSSLYEHDGLCPLGAMMDTSSQPHAGTTAPSTALSQIHKQRRSVEQRRKIVQETLAAGASVARVARVHGVNANQVFHWRQALSRRTAGQRERECDPPAGLGGGVIERDAWNPLRGVRRQAFFPVVSSDCRPSARFSINGHYLAVRRGGMRRLCVAC